MKVGLASTDTAIYRRHMPPPQSNFEKLQDLLLKLKGMTLDVSSSGALAASLDKCVVRLPMCTLLCSEASYMLHRILRSQHSTLLFASWLLAACFLPNTSAPGVYLARLMVIMVWQVQFILILLAQSGDTRVSSDPTKFNNSICV
jgi:hypothetical protein